MTQKIYEFVPGGYAKTERYPYGAPAHMAGVPEQYSAFEHYGEQPANETNHADRAWMVSSVGDTCVVYCQCGKWAASASIYTDPVREVQPLLILRHEAHQGAHA